MKRVVLLSFLFVLSLSSAFAASDSVYCETGEPSGGGPYVDFTFSSKGPAHSAHVSLSWNPKNIDFAPTKHLKVIISPVRVKNVKDHFGNVQIQSSLRLNSDLQLDYLQTLDGEPISATLKSLGKRFSDTEMSCQ